MDEAKADINCISSAGGITSGSTATGAKEVTTSSSSSSSTSSTSAADPEAEDSEKKKKFGKKVQLPIKQIISLDQLRQRFADTAMPPKEIEVIVNSPDSKRKTVKKLKHSLNEFYTFCTCPQCLEYREVILLLMDDQMKTRSTWEILQATLRKAYQPILKNAVSLVKYESFLASEGATWLTTGDVNHTKAQHLNFICDLSLTENMVSVLLSALLLVDDPHQLFELMTFQVECVVKAYWEGFSEIAKMQDKKIPAEEMLSYVLEGYDELCTVSDNISRFLFAFENHHLKKFSLTWTMLNKRMYQQHVYSNITNTMLACIITLKEDELTKKHSMLIKKYIQFDDEMIQMDRLWKDTWTALNLYNLSEEERNRRGRMKSIHDLFNVIRNDVIGTFSQCVDIAEWATHENRQLVWQSMLAYVVKNGADAYSVHLNTVVCDDKCRECNELLEYHMGSCKCVTCAIAGGPLPPKRHPDSTCVRCLTLSRAEKEGALYESKILNVCASDDLFAYKSHNRRRSNSIEDFSDTSSLSLKDEVFNEPDELYEYHLSWAVFKHLRDRKPYVYSRIDEKYFCADCRLPSCLLAKKILNNEIALALSWHLIQHYQPLIMTHEDLTLMLKNIMQYNRKVVASKLRMDPHLDDEVFKIYWAFAVSVIACYFVEFDEETQLNLDYFDLVNNDIQLVTARLKGAEKDGKFFQFLDKISGLSLNEKENKETNRTFESCSGSSSVTTSPDRIEHNVAEYLKGESSKLTENTEEVRTPESEPPEPVTPTESFHPKKCGKDKSKKCCFDHADMSDHCKENHSSKKRIKKECNHARMNETRDRLRKKLSQLVNARKNIKTPILRPPHQQPHCSKTLTPPDSEEPSLADVKLDDDDDSLECLSTLCKRITHQPNKQTPSTSGNQSKKSVFHQSQQQAQPAQVQQSEETQAPPPPPPPTVTIKKRSNSHQTLSPNSGRQRANEFFALLENLPEVSVKKWVNETLSFIEGSSDTKGPVNEKKAAKKAKQKQRKEEMKRIAELQDLRSQFHDIYFKEFAAKYELKILKVSKKKDKKKITDFEANIKKLNRAKAKVETNILELIATVKQTNGEFKFSYLPTKEQQVEKLQELTKEDDDSAQQNQSNSTSSTPSPATEILPPAGALPPQENNLNGGAYYGIPYANANNFAPFAVPNFVSTPNVQMCYAPNQPTDMTDPSKRIVTIRRVNLPNVPEPQVTVTAKGSSPDKDKLLYTFVNGQIVQTSQQQAQQDQQQAQQQQQYAQQQQQQAQQQQQQAHQQQQQAQQQQQQYAQQQQQQAQQQQQQAQQQQQQHHQPPSPPVDVPQKTKTQLKKERKRAKKLAEAEEECERLAEEERLLKEEEAKREEELRRQEELKKQEQAAAAKASKKANNKKKAATAATTKVENKLPANNKKPKKNATPAPSVTSSSQPTTRENSVCSQKVKPKPTAQVREKPPEEENQVAQPSPARTVSKEKEKRQKFIDNGQFDNNQFKMLHLDDFVSSDSAESDVESERESEVEKKVVVPTKPKVVEKPQAPAPITTSTTTTSTTAPANITNIPQKPAEAKPKPKPQQAAIKVPPQPQPQPEPVAEKPSKEQPPPMRRENKERSSRSVKPSPILPPVANHERNNERNRNKSNNMPITRRPSIQIQSQQFVPSQHMAQQQRELLLDKPKRSRKSKNKVQGSIYQATPSVAPNANPKLRRNQSVIYSSSGSKTDPTNALQQSMQNLRLTSNNYPQLPPQQQSNHHDRPERHHYSQQQQLLHQQNHSNVSIMDQLNRGVQVENLSLPPGITLTKVDPSKSEQLRAKSESIKKLSKPLPHAAAPTSNMSQPTIITSGFYPHMSTYGASDHNGVIMVEAMGGASKQINKQQTFSNDGKVSKNRKRRNKKKSDNFKASSAAPPNRNSGGETESSPKMVTLRNPMFGNMMPQTTPSVMPLPNRLPVAPLPMDQPASIIKNENGMFTIRNPALQAAVANGLPVTSYRQFTGNYYTPPQEPIGSASGTSLGSSSLGASTGLGASSSFSYFSNNTTSTHVPNSQTIALDPFNSSNGYACDINDGSLRPNNTGKCISAIGSEVKTAQQLKQRSKESQWQNFSTLDSTPSHDNACNYLGSSLQSNYYNGYDVFSSSSGGSQQLSSSGSLFENSDCPLHHNCEDSPPPTITGFNHYLDGIPNTGIIRYDDASFLKTLMPGQNLNNEVSIHNVNDSNFARNATSPVAHRVEITPVYGNRPTATSLFNNCSNPTQYSPTKGFQPHTHLGGIDFSENLFTPNTLLNLNDLDSGERDVEAFKRFSYDFEPPKEKQKVNININDLFMKSSRSGNSSRSSPFMDDSTLGLEGFVQNLSALKLTDEQCSAVNGNINAGTSPNGWW